MRVKIIRFITYLALLGLIFFSACLDSDSWFPTVACGCCIAWLMLIVIANLPRGGDGTGRRENF